MHPLPDNEQGVHAFLQWWRYFDWSGWLVASSPVLVPFS